MRRSKVVMTTGRPLESVISLPKLETGDRNHMGDGGTVLS